MLFKGLLWDYRGVVAGLWFSNDVNIMALLSWCWISCVGIMLSVSVQY
jgi:hypothetical protein